MALSVERPAPGRWAYKVLESKGAETGRVYGDIRGAAEALLGGASTVVERVVRSADPFDALLRAIGQDPDEEIEFLVHEVPLRQCIRLVA